MKKRLMLILALVLTMLVAGQPLHAQDGGEEDATQELIDLVLTANENLYAAQFFEFDALQTQEQFIGSGVGLRRSVLTRETVLQVTDGAMQVDATGRPIAFDAVLSQNDSRLVNRVIRTDANLSIAYQIRLVDDADLFVRITNIEGIINEEAIAAISGSDRRSQLGSNFLTGWVNLSGNAQQLADDLFYLNSTYNDVDFFDALNLQAILDLNAGITWTPDEVLRIIERASDEDNVRIVEVDIDPVALFEANNLAALVDNDGLAGDTDLMLQEIFAGTTLTQLISIEIDGEGVPTLSSVETEMTVNVEFTDGSEATDDATDATGGVSLDMVMETSTRINYSRIGTEFEIVAPEPELSLETSCDADSLDIVFEITNEGANMEAPLAFTISREGENLSEEELQLEAGTRQRFERRNGVYTFDMPGAEINETVECIEPPEEDDAS